MSDYQIISVSGIKQVENEGLMLDALEKITKEAIKEGWIPIGGISWSPSPKFVTETIYVSQALHKPV